MKEESKAAHARLIQSLLSEPGSLERLDLGVSYSELGQQLYDLREKEGLDHAALAERIGVEAEVIEDLEDGGYEGDALGLAQKIVSLFGMRVRFQVVPSAMKSLLASAPAVELNDEAPTREPVAA